MRHNARTKHHLGTFGRLMTSKKQRSESKISTSGKEPSAAKAEQPEWANGLKQLYDSVVDEPLPDSFKDLLSKLDDESDPAGGSEAS